MVFEENSDFFLKKRMPHAGKFNLAAKKIGRHLGLFGYGERRGR